MQLGLEDLWASLSSTDLIELAFRKPFLAHVKSELCYKALVMQLI